MKAFFLALLFVFQSLHANVMFCEVDSSEAEEIENSLLMLYADQMVEAGLFQDQEEAREAAIWEWCLDRLVEDNFLFYYRFIHIDGSYRGYFVYSLQDQSAHLEIIHVFPEFQNQGLGSQILQDFETLLLEKGVNEVTLHVFAHNKKAIALYKKQGYEIISTYSINGNTGGYHMKKELCKTT